MAFAPASGWSSVSCLPEREKAHCVVRTQRAFFRASSGVNLSGGGRWSCPDRIRSDTPTSCDFRGIQLVSSAWHRERFGSSASTPLMPSLRQKQGIAELEELKAGDRGPRSIVVREGILRRTRMAGERRSGSGRAIRWGVIVRWAFPLEIGPL